MAAAEGNNYSSKNNRLVAETLRRIAVQEDGKKLRSMCEAIYDKAITGDVPAANFIADRLEGKPLQRQEVSGPDGGEIPIGFHVAFRD